MEWLNYHHLLYFWVVARQGGIAQASAELHLAPPTISGQVRELEEALGQKLLVRSGRKLVLTEAGRLVYHHADEIFAAGQQLLEAVKGRAARRPLSFVVGIADVVPKLVVRHLLEPARRLPQEIRFVCREDKPERLLADLSLGAIDLVLADAPVAMDGGARASSHLLVDCGVSFLAAPALAAAHRRHFPRSLEGAPLLVPTDSTALRRSLDQWFHERGIRPRVVAEFDDSALLSVFGQDGMGIFPVDTVIEQAVQQQYGVRLVGRIEDVRERFYAITVERSLENPAVVAICAEERGR